MIADIFGAMPRAGMSLLLTPAAPHCEASRDRAEAHGDAARDATTV